MITLNKNVNANRIYYQKRKTGESIKSINGVNSFKPTINKTLSSLRANKSNYKTKYITIRGIQLKVPEIFLKNEFRKYLRYNKFKNGKVSWETYLDGRLGYSVELLKKYVSKLGLDYKNLSTEKLNQIYKEKHFLGVRGKIHVASHQTNTKSFKTGAHNVKHYI